MRKKQLKKWQLAERDQIIRELGAAGWQGTVKNDRFDSGEFVECEASMEYNGANMTLAVEYDAKGRCLFLRLAAGTRKLLLRIDYGESLASLLAKLVGFQAQLNQKNFQEFVRELARLCPNTFALVGGDEGDWVRVLDQERTPVS